MTSKNNIDNYLGCLPSGSFSIKNYVISSFNDFLAILVKDKTILEYKTKNNNDVYLLASLNGYLELMKYLEKEHNWDVHVKNNGGDDAYLFASFSGHLEIMKYLEKEHNWDIYVKNDQGNNSYIQASMYSRLEIMRYLEQQHDWDINLKNNFGKGAYYFGNEKVKEHIDFINSYR